MVDILSVIKRELRQKEDEIAGLRREKAEIYQIHGDVLGELQHLREIEKAAREYREREDDVRFPEIDASDRDKKIAGGVLIAYRYKLDRLLANGGR